MAMLPNIRIDIASSFDGKGFKAASRSSSLLTRQFRTLGLTVASALSVQAITRFARESVKAFAEEEAAITKLNKTFENLGMRYEGLAANDFISQLQRQVAVADDELRPALETLVRSTLDYGKAQELLNVALDVSAGTGKDLQTVSTALSKAYLGQTSVLGKLNVGIGQVEAKTISFDDAISRLNDRFKGQAAANVETYAGKFRLLSIAAEDAREATGERLLIALQLLAKDQTIEGLADDMQTFADKIGLASIGLADLLGKLNRKIQLGGRTFGEILFAAAGGGFIDALAKVGAVAEYGVKQRTLGAPGALQQAAKDAAIRKQMLEDQKKMIALQKKAAAEQAKNARLKAISNALLEKEKKFDLQRIQITAALQGQITKDERTRLEQLLLIEDLKIAIAQRDLETAERLQKELKSNFDIAKELNTTLTNYVANNPFTFWGTYFNAQDKERKDLADSLGTFNANTPFTTWGSEWEAQADEQYRLKKKLETFNANDPFKDWDAYFATQKDSISQVDKGLANLQKAAALTKIDAEGLAQAAADAWDKVFATTDKRTKDALTAMAKAAEDAAAAAEKKALAALEKLNAAQNVVPKNTSPNDKFAGVIPGFQPDPGPTQPILGSDLATLSTSSAAVTTLPLSGVGGATVPTSVPTTVVVNVAGTVTSETDLAQFIIDSVYKAQSNGIGISYKPTAI